MAATVLSVHVPCAVNPCSGFCLTQRETGRETLSLALHRGWQQFVAGLGIGRGRRAGAGCNYKELLRS